MAIGLLQAGNFFLPVQPILAAAILLLGSAGFVLFLRSQWRSLSKHVFSLRMVSAVLLWLGLGVFCALQAMRPIEFTDTGGYHLMAVKWASEFPVVPGLGNLQGGLGSGGAYFLFGALVNVGPFLDQSYLLVNGLLAWMLLGQSLIGVSRIVRGKSHSLKDFFYALILAPLLQHLGSILFNSLSPDSAIFVLQLFLAAEWLGLLEDDTASTFRLERLETVIAVSAIGMVIKQSFFVFGGISILAACILVAWKNRSIRWRPTLGLGLLSLAILLPGLARTAVFSGYVGFPTTIAPLPVDWRMPAEKVDAYQQWLKWRAQNPDLPKENMGKNENWFSDWIKKLPKQSLAMVEISLLLGILILASMTPGMAWRVPFRLLFLPFLAVVSLAFWFLTVPNIRFAGALFWILGLGMLMVLIRSVTVSTERTRFPIAVFLIALFWIWVSPISEPPSFSGISIITPPSGVQSPQYDTYPLSETTPLNVPREGELCWTIPLPCTDDPDSRIKLVDPGNMLKGFRYQE